MAGKKYMKHQGGFIVRWTSVSGNSVIESGDIYTFVSVLISLSVSVTLVASSLVR